MKGLVITIGNEILCGDIVNRDLAIIAQIAKEYNISIIKEITVRDKVSDITNALSESSGYDIVFVSGGLGPTEDDVTRNALSLFLKKELVMDSALLDKIEKRVKKWNIPQNSLHKKYGYYPEGCLYVENPAGLAPGLICKKEGTVIVILPGPPRELEPTLKNALKKLGFSQIKHEIVKIYRTFGIREVDLQNIIREIVPEGNLEVGYYPSIYGVKLKIKYPDEDTLKELETIIKKRLGKVLYSENDEEMEEVFGKILKEKGLTVATAESCTGGLIGDLITRVSGSSNYFMGGIVAYSNDVKVKLLGCSEDSLKKYGAVSEQIAREMAEGVRKVMKTDIGISTTGIAGPTGGTPQKPVGLVYIGFSDREKTEVIRKVFKGVRQEIKQQAALWALDLARRMLV